jgi:hypothetical protein
VSASGYRTPSREASSAALAQLSPPAPSHPGFRGGGAITIGGTAASAAAAGGSAKSLSGDALVPLRLHAGPVLLLAPVGGSAHRTALVTVDACRELGTHAWYRNDGAHFLEVDPRLPAAAATLRGIILAARPAAASRASSGTGRVAADAAGAPAAASNAMTVARLVRPLAFPGRKELSRAATVGIRLAPAIGSGSTARLAPVMPLAASGRLAAQALLAAPLSLASPWLRPALFALSSDGSCVLSAGHWDGSLRVTSVVTGQLCYAAVPAAGAANPVTCVATVRLPAPALAVGAASLVRVDSVSYAAMRWAEDAAAGAVPGARTDGGAVGPAGPSGANADSSQDSLSSIPLLQPRVTSSEATPAPTTAVLSHLPEPAAGLTGRFAPHAAAAVLAVGGGAELVVCGSTDGSVHFYELVDGGRLRPRALRVLRLHQAAVTSVALCAANDTLVTGSDDGSAVACSLRSGLPRVRLTPMVRAPERSSGGGNVAADQEAPMPPGAAPGAAPSAAYAPAGPVAWVGVSPCSRAVALYCPRTSTLHAFTLNGIPLAPPAQLSFRARAFCWSLDGQHLLVGGDGPYVLVYDVHTLAVETKIGANGCYLRAPRHTFGAAAAATPKPGRDTLVTATAAAEATRLRGETADSGGALGPAAALPVPHRVHNHALTAPSHMWQHPPSSPAAPSPVPRVQRVRRLPAAVTALALSAHEQALFVGLANGEVRVFVSEATHEMVGTLSTLEEFLGF